MRKIVIATIVMITVALGMAMIVRGSFTRKDDLNDYIVATAEKELLEIFRDSMEDIESDCKYILRVKCTSEVLFMFKQTYQKVEVLEVYKGDDNIKINDIINIMPVSSWIFKDDNSVNLGFINSMIEEKEYLVFLDDMQTSFEIGMEIYSTSNALLTTIFSYEDISNKVVSEEYVDYAEVKDYEIFTSSQEAIDIFLELKANLFKKYM